jgi:hypothetical protein
VLEAGRGLSGTGGVVSEQWLLSVEERPVQQGNRRERKSCLKWRAWREIQQLFFEGVHFFKKTHLFPDNFVGRVHEIV